MCDISSQPTSQPTNQPASQQVSQLATNKPPPFPTPQPISSTPPSKSHPIHAIHSSIASRSLTLRRRSHPYKEERPPTQPSRKGKEKGKGEGEESLTLDFQREKGDEMEAKKKLGRECYFYNPDQSSESPCSMTVSFPRFQAVPLGLVLASFLAFWSSFAFFFCSSFFSSFLRFRLRTSSSVLAMGLKNPSSRACVAVFRFFVSRVAALRTRSSLKPFSVTRKVTRPSMSGASHLKSHSGWSGGRTSGWKKSSRASW